MTDTEPEVREFLVVLQDICNNIYDLVDVMKDIRSDLRAIRDKADV